MPAKEPQPASNRANQGSRGAFQGAGAQVVLAGMSLPPNYGPDYVQGFEQIFRDLNIRLPALTVLLIEMSNFVASRLRNPSIKIRWSSAMIMRGCFMGGSKV